MKLPVKVGAATVEFIVDTGASISIIPRHILNTVTLNPTPVRITSATGENIVCHGETYAEVIIPQSNRAFKWNFVIANTTHALLGLDFLAENNLIVDCKNGKLIDPLTKKSSKLHQMTGKVLNMNINKFNVPELVQDIIDKYPEVVTPRKGPKPIADQKVFHFIDRGNQQPVFCKRRLLPPDKLIAAQNEFKQLMENGIIRPSKSP